MGCDMDKRLLATITATAALAIVAAPLQGCSNRSDAGDAATAGTAASSTGGALAQTDADPGAFGRYVDTEGNISLPEDFATEWAHLGSWAVAKDGGVEGIHNVYAPKEEVEYFRQHLEFRDGAMMVKEVRAARGAAHTTGDAHWAEDVQVWFLMVKDRKARFPENPLWGDGWGWALYNGGDRSKQVATDYKKDCLGCHVPAEKTDFSYVYGYPLLGPQVAQYAPREEAAASMAAAAMTTMASSSGDPMGGEEVYRRCAACHSLTSGQHGLGPSLAGVFGRKAGAAEGYSYSPAMKNSNVVWDDGTLDAHLKDVRGFIPGNKMAALFPGGVQDAAERAAVIAYIKAASK